MIPLALLNEKITIKRRIDTGRDSLNNPTYGTPTSGSGWSTVYSNVSVRFAFSDKFIVFDSTGERIHPEGTMYFKKEFDIKHEDRAITSDGIEYVVTAVRIGRQTNGIVNHKEAKVSLP